MAFFIVTAGDQDFSWTMDEKKPHLHSRLSSERIAVFKADGQELDLICARFRNVPHSFKECTWRNDMAQFIYDNL